VETGRGRRFSFVDLGSVSGMKSREEFVSNVQRAGFRWWSRVAALLAATLLGMVVASPPASAINWVRTYSSYQTGLCLDSNYAGNVYTLGCNAGNYQRWTGEGVYAMKNVQTGLCLDSNYAGDVYTLGCNGGNYQNWGFYLDPTGATSGALLINNQTGRCLDSNYAGHVYTLPCNGGNYQIWFNWAG
jgi:hypothetical protein